MEIQKLTDTSFGKYGKVVTEFSFDKILKEMEHTPLPKDVVYVPSVEQLEEVPEAAEVLGLGVQAPTPEWGAMLNEAKDVLTSNPTQMIAPGIAIVVLVCCFNLMGDALRDVLDPKEVEK